MDSASETYDPFVDIPLSKIIGAIVLCVAIIGASLSLSIMWIIRVGKAEHAEKQKALAKKDD
ncbi:hypothetical protein BGX26_006614 [Mortierella sp. AD094]|nr:hypothetical protein BGX26_006614 [Mortierella sp. AD094]